MTQQPLLLVMFLLAIAVVACDRSGRSASKAPELSGTTAMVRSTADLENAVKAKFKVDEQLRSADLGVNADSTNNEITLSGAVESQILRSKAVDLARSVDSGVTVNDQIEVKPSGRTAENVLRNQQRHGSTS
jgi:osmotically-inducible protein OsmY